VAKDLDIVNILKTLSKLKAGVSVLMERDECKISSAKLKYYKSCQIEIDNDNDENHLNSINEEDPEMEEYFKMDDK